jgi:hypothetical protein
MATDSRLVLAFVTEVMTRVPEGFETYAWMGDSASFHGFDLISPHLCKGVLWLKNAVASPTLSAIEVVFGQVKARFKAYNRASGFKEMDQSIIKAFEKVEKKDVFGAFRLSLKFMLRAYAKEPIFVDSRTAEKELEKTRARVLSNDLE